MIFKSRLFFLIVICAALALLSCTGQENPFKPQDAKVNLAVENSINQLSKDSVTDTVENLVRVGLSAYLPTYITQVTVTIARGTTDTDKVITFANASTWTDTQWILINLHTIGKHTVTVVTTLQGSAQKTSTASIEIVGKKIPLAANPLGNSVTEGQSNTFFVSVTGAGSVFTYQWIQNGIILSGANKDTLIVNPVYLADSGSYLCVIKDQWGDSIVSQPAFLHVTANPAVNHKPVLSISGARSIVSGQACALSLSETDADSGQTHTYAMPRSPVSATLTGTSFTWSTPATFEGIDTVVFTVTDNGNPPMSDTQNVYITVGSQSVKTPPVIMVPAADTAPSVAQGKSLSFTVQTVASAGDTITLSAASISGAKLPDSAAFDPTNGQFTWTPTFGELGVYSIVFTATDGNGVSKDTVKITVTKTDRAPTVQAQSVNTTTGQAITVSLLASDPDNDSITQWQLFQKPHNGTATLADSTKGSIVYTPSASFTGADTFAVKASDGTLWSAAANVIVTVSSLKVAPKITTQTRTDTSVALGGSVSFTVATNNASPTPTYIWYHGTKGSATLKDSSTNPLYQITNVAAADSGNYFVVVVNSSGADTSAYAHLTVNLPPSAPTLTAPANNATGVAVSQTLTWGAVAGAVTYHVQVSTASDFSTGIIVDDSTLTTASKAVSSLANITQYYWHVNAKNAGGTSVWSTAFSFTTIVAASGVPVLSAPANGATGIAVSPTLTWGAVTGATTYRVQVSTASDFSTGIVADDSTLTTATKALTGLSNNTLYYWHVNAKNASGTSAWSTAFSFTTIVAAPTVPILSTPANNATGVATSQAVSWSAVAGAATYRVQVSTASDFSTGIVADDSTLTAATKALSGLSNSTQYYWRVDAKNAGGTSAWSTAFGFTTVVAVSGVPIPSAPSNGATGVSLAPALTWSTVTGAATYRVQVSTASDFSTGIVVDDSTLTAATKALTGLANSTQYYWRVNAKNAGGTSIWSSVSSFTTIVAAPSAPTLTLPAANATGVSLTPTLTWGTVTGAVSYEVQVSTSTTFATTVFDQSGITVTTQAVTPALANGTLYYWRANATNAGGTSGWTATMSFTTIVAAPGVPTLSAPANNASGISASPTVTWGAVTGAVTYRVQVSTASDFLSGIIVDDSTLTAASKVAGTLTKGTKYYWRVNAKNAGGTSTWSATSNFTTIVQFALTLNATNGSITPNPTGSPYDSGTVVSLAAAPATGYGFTGWSGGLTGATNPASITMNAAKTVTATFAINTFNITASTVTNGTISPSGVTTVNYGAGQTYTITPATGYSVASLLIDNVTTAVATTYSFSNVTAAHTIGATFSLNTYALTLSAGTGGTITVPTSSPTNVSANTPFNISATPSVGYKFAGWAITAGTGATIASNTSAATTVTLTTGAVTVTASFTALACSWNQVADYSITHNSAYAISTSGDTILVGLQKFGVDRSTDNGTTWPGGVGPGAFYVTAVAQYGGLTLASSRNNGGIYVSTDNGGTWNENSVLVANMFTMSGGIIYAGTGVGMVYSSDNGATWLSEQAYLTLTGNVNAILVVGNGIYASSNGTLYYRALSGYSWVAVAGAPSGVMALFTFGGNVYAGTSTGIYLHDPNSGNWVSEGNSGLPGGVSIAGYAETSSYIFAGTASNGVYVSNNNGTNWTAVNGGLPNGGSTDVEGIASNSGSVFIISGSGQGVYSSPLP